MVKVVTTFEELRAARKALPEPVGLVPTMGFLHEGHLSLVRRAKEKCASVVVSIFVNPTQFGPTEDLAAYPRDLDHDVALLESAGVDVVWAPTPEGMYPPDYQTWVTVDNVTKPLEGARRPTHFRGVTTVVAKLFIGVQPQMAFFGQKDAQQVVVLKQMARDLNFPIELEVCPIVRESDGLARSSRNTYLNPQERQAALCLSKSLAAARQAYADGERDAHRLIETVMGVLNREPLAKVHYVSCADTNTLEELDTIKEKALISMAVYIGKTRLIDNLILGD
ncbi:MAG: pantoate--beta-alanine ligase [Anaerolineaceae bacterium]